MSLGRKKKNSTLLAGSTTVRSLGSRRRRYPASERISAADSLSAPLLGTATRSIPFAEPLAGRESFADEPLARRESFADEPLARRESFADEPLARRESFIA